MGCHLKHLGQCRVWRTRSPCRAKRLARSKKIARGPPRMIAIATPEMSPVPRLLAVATMTGTNFRGDRCRTVTQSGDSRHWVHRGRRIEPVALRNRRRHPADRQDHQPGRPSWTALALPGSLMASRRADPRSTRKVCNGGSCGSPMAVA